MTMTDYLTAVEVIGLAVWIEIALEVMPFSRLLQRLGRLSPETPSAAVDPVDVHRLNRFVVVAGEILPIPTTCLRQSLVLYALLQRRAVKSRVCLGVARNGAALDAHAWIECDGLDTGTEVTRFSELQTTSQNARTSELSPI
jgi:hypothetical protein